MYSQWFFSTGLQPRQDCIAATITPQKRKEPCEESALWPLAHTRSKVELKVAPITPQKRFERALRPLAHMKHLLFRRYEGDVVLAWGEWEWVRGPLPRDKALWHPPRKAEQTRALTSMAAVGAGSGDSRLWRPLKNFWKF